MVIVSYDDSSPEGCKRALQRDNEGQDLMQELRSSRRSRTLLDGRIVFDGGLSTVECTVVNVSDSGVQISLPHPINIPREFTLEIPKRKKSTRARVVWSDE